MSTHCYSCGMPLNETNSRGNNCQYCTDESGNLLPREVIKAGLAEWLKEFSPDKDGKVDFQQRAEYYMKSMPAWAE